MHARITRYEGSPADEMDANLEEKRGVLPTAFGQAEGMKGMIFMGDRQGGAVLVISLWEDENALNASESEATRVREEVQRPDETTTVERFEVAHLRVEQS
jgi:hypothetical protein